MKPSRLSLGLAKAKGWLGHSRLVLAILAPMVALVVFSVMMVNDRLQDYRRNSDLLKVAQLARSSRALTRELEAERSLSTQAMSGLSTAWVPALIEQRQRVNERLADYQGLTQHSATGAGAASETRLLAELIDRARAAVDGHGDLRTVIENYSVLVAAATRAAENSVPLELTNLIAAYMDLGSVKDRIERSRSLGAAMIAQGAADREMVGLLAEARAERHAFIESFRQHAASDQAAIFTEVVRGPVPEEIERLHRLALAGKMRAAETENWHRAHFAMRDLVERAETRLEADVEAEIGRALSETRTTFYMVLVGTVLLVAFSLETLRRSERRAVLWQEEARKLFRAVEQSPVAVMITDTKGDIEYTNPAFTRMTGFERAEMIGQNPRVLKSDQVVPGTYEELWQTIRAGQEWRGEVVNRRKDGTLYREKMIVAPVKNGAGDIDSYIALKEDVTEVHQLRQALEHEHAHLRHILASIRDGIALIDGDDTMLYGNPALEASFGPIAGRKALDYFGQALPAGGEWQPADSPLTYEVTTIPLHSPDGSAAMLAAFHDVTQRLQAEHATLEARDAAALANRSKSEFLATMSHELRTPLNAIIGFSEIIENELLGPIGTPQYGEYAHDINVSGRHLLQIINDMLDIARIDIGHIVLRRDRVATCETLNNCIGLVRERASVAGVALSTSIPHDLPDMTGDARRIKQAAVNILGNAIKFTPTGGQVRLTAELVEDGLAVRVADNGIGIAPEDLSKILAPFGQADSSLVRRFEGAGLGLPLSAKLIELHGGRLSIDSRLGGGTTVTLWFPASILLKAP
ncbi:MAG: PAS domain S-box protein [Alphaproteobacteria bacterium]|nr:PAS domain S-box protein [Alphaproteobacteria bacterium]